MQNYADLSGQSNVARYETGTDFIIVEFKSAAKDGSKTYKYTNTSAGEHNIVQMKQLAEVGRGLNTFINQHVKKLYESKW